MTGTIFYYEPTGQARHVSNAQWEILKAMAETDGGLIGFIS
jgi:hypothetical protein